MNSINIYYKRIIEKFGKSAKIEEENTIAPTISQLEELPIDSSLSLDTKASQYDSDSMTKKRNKKLEFKENMALVETVIDKNRPLKYNTLTDYTQILKDFLKFSPKGDVNDYERYLKFKSGLDINTNSDNFVVKGTLIKHANVIKRFLEKLHNHKVSKVNIQYYKIPDRVNVNFYPKITREELFRHYKVLSDNKKYEDAILLHSMYELGIEPYNLCLFTFDGLHDNRTIKYYDHKIRGIKEVNLSISLYSEFVYLKMWKKMNGELNNWDKRESLYGFSVFGDFIFSTKATGIYNKFERKFGGLLKDFDYTPRDLIVLSKYMKRKEDSSFYE